MTAYAPRQPIRLGLVAGLPAVRAFEVAIFHERDRRAVRAAHVIALRVDRHGEVDDEADASDRLAEDVAEQDSECDG